MDFELMFYLAVIIASSLSCYLIGTLKSETCWNTLFNQMRDERDNLHEKYLKLELDNSYLELDIINRNEEIKALKAKNIELSTQVDEYWRQRIEMTMRMFKQ